MTDNTHIAPGIDFKDRKGWLVVFGVIQILLGVICAMFIPFMIFSILVLKNAGQPTNSGMALQSCFLYLLLAVMFIWLGIGSIMARRWARALTLIYSWLWLISGICGLIYMILAIPVMRQQMSQKDASDGLVIVIIAIMMAFIALIVVVLPGVLVMFYRGKNVKWTCEHRDPQTRWTDKCPLPVLAVSFISGWGALTMLFWGVFGCPMPFFGHIIQGLPGFGLSLLSALLLAYAVWGAYKLDTKAWWTFLVVIIAWLASSAMTFTPEGLMEFYEKMGYLDRQIELLKKMIGSIYIQMAVLFGVSSLALIGYMIYIKRYFKNRVVDYKNRLLDGA